MKTIVCFITVLLFHFSLTNIQNENSQYQQASLVTSYQIQLENIKKTVRQKLIKLIAEHRKNIKVEVIKKNSLNHLFSFYVNGLND